MINKYYEVQAIIDGELEIMYGSFIKSECKDEITAERDNWKAQGYSKFKVITREVNDAPDPDVYADSIVSKHSLFMQQAPSFNFELDSDELLEQALESGFVTAIDGRDDAYLINREYGE
jgi:hypothetical protein